MNDSFTPFDLQNGLLHDYSEDRFPTRLHGFDGPRGAHMAREGSTCFGFVLEGRTSIYSASGHYELSAGMYFAVPHPFFVRGGRGIVVERMDYLGTFMIGGPIENRGRLRYIDGCTDSLIIPPVKKGDACLNALYFPAGTDQTEHTHPSMRVGIVVSGHGMCVTPDEEIPLFPGQVFIIHAEGQHKFRTEGRDEMVVVAYHPDSDHGPEDQFHPMINRTIVDGVSASYRDDIRTGA